MGLVPSPMRADSAPASPHFWVAQQRQMRLMMVEGPAMPGMGEGGGSP